MPDILQLRSSDILRASNRILDPLSCSVKTILSGVSIRKKMIAKTEKINVIANIIHKLHSESKFVCLTTRFNVIGNEPWVEYYSRRRTATRKTETVSIALPMALCSSRLFDRQVSARLHGAQSFRLRVRKSYVRRESRLSIISHD